MSEITNNTFELIHSLSGNEKRHFVLYSGRHTGTEGNLGLMLFHDLEKEIEWNKKEFFRKYGFRPYIRHYRFHKHRLYREVLKSLHVFQRGSSAKEKLREELHHASLLMEKGMFNACQKLIKEAKKTAREYELTILLYEFIKLESELARETNFAGMQAADLKRIHKEMDQTWETLRKQQDRENNNAEVFMEIARDGMIRENKVRANYLKRLQSFNRKEVGDIDSFRSRFLNYQSHLFICTVSGNYKEGALWSEKLLGLFNKSEYMKREMMRAYLIVLHNRIIILNNLKRYADLEEPFRELKKLNPGAPQLKNRLFYASNNLLLTTLTDVGEFEDAYVLLRHMQYRLKRGEVSWLNRQHETTHWYAATICCFGSERWKEANKYMQKILNAGDLSHRTDLLFLCHILEIFLQIESGKRDLVEYSVRSARRFFKQKKGVFKFEDTVLDFINSYVPEMNSESEKRKGYKVLYDKLKPLAKLRSEKAVFDNFDFLSWLEAKIGGEKFSRILQRKAISCGWSASLNKAISAMR